MSDTPTPRTDAVVHNIAELGVFARQLERELAGVQLKMDEQATQLLHTVNDRNRLGVQLDLLRDEFARLVARIGEAGVMEDWRMSSIVSLCERARKDIETLYTPIQERESEKRRADKAERELAAANHQITLLIAGSKKDERQLRRLKDALQEAYEEGYADCSFGEDCNYQASRAKRIAEGKE